MNTSASVRRKTLSMAIPEYCNLIAMRRWGSAVFALAWLTAATAAAQTAPPADLQGTWTNGTITPLERPPALAGKAFLTEEEAATQEQQSAERRNARVRRPGDVGSDNEAFVDTGYKVVSTRQTSLVVDPPDGRIPMLPAAEKGRDFNVASLDSFETMSPWDRCITRGPTGLFPAGYNNGYQIVQTPTHVVIVTEMIHEARVVPLDGRPHVDPRIRLWAGDSRGRWEGATLVVETTNFHDRGWFSTHAGSGRLRGVPHSDALRLVERFTRVDAGTIIYEMTVEDPSAYARPWTFSVPLVRSDDYRLYEYACHEGNQATALMLRGARTLEREAGEAAKKP
jgi:hypothetical protein